MDRERFRAIQTRRSFFRECAGGIGTVLSIYGFFLWFRFQHPEGP